MIINDEKGKEDISLNTTFINTKQ